MISFLYPRLLAGQATPLYNDYCRLSISDLADRIAFTHESAVYVATGGDRVSVEQLRELRAGIVDLATRAGFPGASDRASNAEFDLAVAAFLHGEMGMVPAEAAARDVWAFLALVVLPDVAFWRYPQPPKDRVLGTDLTRHVFGRLWWRAQLVRSHDAPEPYGALKILGEAAFDQIYARRAALGGSPHMVRAILRVWNDLDLKGLNERETLRDFLKRLLRLAPFVLFDGVGEAALDNELRAVANESLVAQQRTSDPGTSIEFRPSTQTTPFVESLSPEASDSTPPSPEPSPPETARMSAQRFRSVEICAGCGAQALGLEQAGFDPVLLIDSKADACFTIEANRPAWDVVCMEISHFRVFERQDVIGVDLLSGGLPRVKSAASGKRDEGTDERGVLRATIDLVRIIRPKAVLLENVPDLIESPHFEADRLWITETLAAAGYECSWAVLNAADFGVPQNRRSGFLVALQSTYHPRFTWPQPIDGAASTVGQALGPSMSARGWPGADSWVKEAQRVAPALVGGSDRRGGADLGPTGSKKAWEALGVDGSSLANEPPGPDFPESGLPKLTVEQAALIQSIPEGWRFNGGKTSRYRQIGHAMPPPLATAVGQAIAAALRG